MNESNSQSVEPIENMFKRLHVGAVFGEPIQESGATIIPVAEVMYGFGYGAGGSGSPAQADAETAGAGGGHGAGGGGGGRAKAVGYIRITPGSVSYHPLVDPMRIALAGIFALAWSIFWITKAIAASARK
jgi:uncharacterized spore protein YtfJ